MKRISWERIRMVRQEQDKKGTTDNMFRLEAIAQAQLDSCEKEVKEIFEKIEKTGALRGHRYVTEGTIRQTRHTILKDVGYANTRLSSRRR